MSRKLDLRCAESERYNKIRKTTVPPLVRLATQSIDYYFDIIPCLNGHETQIVASASRRREEETA